MYQGYTEFEKEWNEFKIWQNEYDKHYSSEEEVNKRFSVYMDNKEVINRLNELHSDRLC